MGGESKKKLGKDLEIREERDKGRDEEGVKRREQTFGEEETHVVSNIIFGHRMGITWESPL